MPGRNHHSEYRKKNIIERWSQPHGLTLRDFAKREGIPFSTVKDIVKPGASVKRRPGRSAVFPELEKELSTWIKEERSVGLMISNTDIRARASEIAARDDIKEFNASDGWITNFKKRNRFSYRVPIHTARKDELTAEDIKEQEQFLDTMTEVVEQSRLPLNDLINFDQTMVRLVSPQPKTVSPIGLEEVNVVNPPGDKEGSTIGLAIQANGGKLPAVIVFKGAKQTGVLSENIMKKLKIPGNVIVRSTKSAWWNEDLDAEWIDFTFPAAIERSRVLVRDQATCHKTTKSKQLLKERRVMQVFVPVGMTGKYQALDVGVNKPFKAGYRTEYHKWRCEHRQKTKKGYLRKPNRQDFIDMVSAAWEKVTFRCVRNSFVAANLVSKEYAENWDTAEVEHAQAAENSSGEQSMIECSFFDESMLEESSEEL